MEVVYFFCENTRVRIPLFDYDKRLFNLLVAKGGIWDKIQRQFIFRQNISANQFSSLLPGLPCVWVEEDTATQVRVYGFFGRPWEQNFNGGSNTRDSPRSPLIEIPKNNPHALSEKFPEHWRIKLETELRSRKYSNVHSGYIYSLIVCYVKLYRNRLKKLIPMTSGNSWQ